MQPDLKTMFTFCDVWCSGALIRPSVDKQKFHTKNVQRIHDIFQYFLSQKD